MSRVAQSGVLVIVLVLAAVACEAAPRIVFEETLYDFGVVVDGEAVSHGFVFRNEGDEPLVILDVASTCGCTTTELAESTVAPGATRRIGVTVDTAGYGGSAMTKSVTVTTNDPTQPKVTLGITGNVVPKERFLVEPEDLARSLLLLVDVRDWGSYASGHLLGAVSLPADDAAVWLELLPKDMPIVLYDQDGTASSELASRMLSMEYIDVSVLIGGLDEWVLQYGDRMIVRLQVILAPVQTP